MEEMPDVELLVAEIGRYLAAVDVFRAEDCEPRWLEMADGAAAAARAAAGDGKALLHVRDVIGRARGGVNDETV